MKIRAGHMMFVKFVRVFDGFDAKKEGAQKHCQQKLRHLIFPVSRLSGINRKRHRQTATDQDNRIKGP